MIKPSTNYFSFLKKVRKSTHETGQYLWHFAHEEFSHNVWWKPGKKNEIEAGLWELFRRHPQMSEPYSRIKVALRVNRIRVRQKESQEHLFWAGRCYKAWPNLSKPERQLWRDYLKKVAPRHGFNPNPVVILDGLENAFEVGYYSKPNPNQYDSFLSQAVNCAKAGKLILAIDPLANDLYKKIMEEIRQWRKPTRGRARTANWLAIIQKFEREEMHLDKRKFKRTRALFEKYRDVISIFHWRL